MRCFRSLFAIHNETVNVWSHLVGFFLFIGLGSHVFISALDVEFQHYLIFILFMVSCLACMGFSAMYHLLCCHSISVFQRMMCCDYCGISMLIVGSFLPPVYYAFSCEPHMRWVYLPMIAVLGSVSIVAPFFEFFDKPEFQTKRVLMFVITGASGVFPALHAMFIAPLNRVTLPLHRGIGLMFLFYGVGTLVYVSKWPERWFPGRFDIWLHSHQLWHIFVLCAAVVHFYTCVGVYQRHAFDQC